MMEDDQITQDMIDGWRINYGLDKMSPSEAARWWSENQDGRAPAGAVAALGLCLIKLERLRAEVEALRRDAERWRWLVQAAAECSPTLDRLADDAMARAQMGE